MNDEPMNPAKKELLTHMFLKYWKYDTVPDFDNIVPNSPEELVLKVYDTLKKRALGNYQWRSATKYVWIICDEPEIRADGRYRFESTVPDNFLSATGFWADKERRQDAHNSVDIVGRSIRTNLDAFTLGYIDGSIPETDLDSWVIEYLEIFIASEAADIGGVGVDDKNYLLQKAANDLIILGNKDFEMAHHDEISASIHQFEIC